MITVVVGPPGCGKTHFVKEHMAYDIFLDDPKYLDLSKVVLRPNENLVIAHPCFCHEKHRKIIKEQCEKNHPYHKFRFIFFENDFEKCKNNIDYRRKNGDLRDTYASLKHFSKIYTIPCNEEIIPIWKKEK